MPNYFICFKFKIIVSSIFYSSFFSFSEIYILILISDFSIEIDNIPIKGGKFNYEEELNKFLTNIHVV